MSGHSRFVNLTKLGQLRGLRARRCRSVRVSPGSPTSARDTELAQGFRAGVCGGLGHVRGGGQHDEVDGSLATEVEEFICGEICTEVLHVPVVFSQCEGSHGRGQCVAFAGECRDDDGAPAPAARVRVVVAEDAFHDGRGPVLVSDRDDSVAPVTTDASHRRHEDLLGDRRHRRTIAGQAIDEITQGTLVTVDESVVGALRELREAGAGPKRPARRRPGALSGESLDVVGIELVSAANPLRWQTTGPNPLVGGLIVDAEPIGGGLQIDRGAGHAPILRSADKYC